MISLILCEVLDYIDKRERERDSNESSSKYKYGEDRFELIPFIA